MKLHFVNVESHLTLCGQNEAKEVYKPEKKVADLDWPKTDSTLTASAFLR